MPDQPDSRIVASPLLDRTRIADAIQRGVHLELNPVYAKAALHGMPVELTSQQALDVADVALEALAKSHPDGKTWLVKANHDLRYRNEIDRMQSRIQLTQQRRTTDSWRALTLNAYVLLFGLAAYTEWHWPWWARAVVVTVGIGGAAVFRAWLMRRERQRTASR